MNKTILIAGGTAAASLAIGAAGGYLYAKRRFNDSLPEIIDTETAAVKKHYSVMLMEAQSGKPASPADIPKQNSKTLLGLTETLQLVVSDSEEEDDENGEGPSEPIELTDADKKAMEKGRRILREAKAALTDYGKISTTAVAEKPPIGGVIASNIFDQAANAKRKPRPPRDPQGHYRKRTPRELENDPPQIIEVDVFLQNEAEAEQESLLYFIRDKTLVQEADPSEAVDIAWVGEVNLTLFPQVPEDEPCMIYVHNTALGIMYEIKSISDSLTEYLGLGENGGDEPEDDAAYL